MTDDDLRPSAPFLTLDELWQRLPLLVLPPKPDLTGWYDGQPGIKLRILLPSEFVVSKKGGEP